MRETERWGLEDTRTKQAPERGLTIQVSPLALAREYQKRTDVGPGPSLRPKKGGVRKRDTGRMAGPASGVRPGCYRWPTGETLAVRRAQWSVGLGERDMKMDGTVTNQRPPVARMTVMTGPTKVWESFPTS